MKKAYFERTDVASIVIDNVLDLIYGKFRSERRGITYSKYLKLIRESNGLDESDVIKEETRIGTSVPRQSLKPLIPKKYQIKFNDYDLNYY